MAGTPRDSSFPIKLSLGLPLSFHRYKMYNECRGGEGGRERRESGRERREEKTHSRRERKGKRVSVRQRGERKRFVTGVYA